MREERVRHIASGPQTFKGLIDRSALRPTLRWKMMERDDEKGFEVEDRRRFDPIGNPRDKSDVDQNSGPETHEAANRPVEKELPAIDFSTFVLSLSTSAIVHLGEAQPPEGGEQRKDLELAKQTIDILGLLQDKTKGNLSTEEKQLLDELLYDLRLRYVAARR